MVDRRALLRAAGVAARAGAGVGLLAPMGLVGLLGGCGFALRSATALPFEKIFLEGASETTSIGQELRRQLAGRVQFVREREQAQVVLSVELARREKLVTGLTSAGLVRELLLRLRVRFRLATSRGRVLIDSTELVLQRDMSTTETAALAKAREEDEIFRFMERDVVLQMIRRFEATSLPTSAP